VSRHMLRFAALILALTWATACTSSPRRASFAREAAQRGDDNSGTDGSATDAQPAEGEGEGEPGDAEGANDGAGAPDGDGVEATGEGEGEGEGEEGGEGEGGEGEGGEGGQVGGADEGGSGDPDCEPSREICDGGDNDCDGEIDEDDPGLGDSCDSGQLGPCWQGRRRCIEGGLTCQPVVDPYEETCDGVDNDCDGTADEGRPESNQQCEAEVLGECGFGLTRCEGVFLWCDGLDPSEELCDGLDNDCDGTVDEAEPEAGGPGGPGDGLACDTGEPGVCAQGVGVCEDGAFRCEQAVFPSDEQCDGLDNDCDGEDDEDDGQGECVRDFLMVCGSSGRDVMTFVPEGVALQRRDGCAPDADVQAMLIPRSGGNRIDGAGARAYLEAGGVIITEYSVSHTVYNSILGGAHPQGGRHGGCGDNIPLTWRGAEDDPFWVANLPVGDAGREGCGHSVGHLPDLTLLAGWSANSAAVGYIDVGAGRLWLVDVDWQDREASQTAYTRQLLGYMILNR